ncbi:hypothetical protein ACH61_00932 [Rathayibacter tanaceti]|uniref:Uncharacterized protein n=1 Tax=Rathayibacter tanaceti TaxID=1671680 RepID=A0A168GA38_9MICO|nr:hypothetical protein ACH61_00932 [Rathayibacter tanaceti]
MSTATLEQPPAAPAAPEAFTVTFIIRRFDPEVDAEPRWQDFDVEMYSTTGSWMRCIASSGTRTDL